MAKHLNFSDLISAFKTALVVGTILFLINQYEVLLNHDNINFTKAILSYCVPFSVFLYGRLSAPPER
ncbi:hypothetical protein BFC17_08100 [Alteromonas lipolytica]|uniref:Dihydrolipoamide dehydrogenase n=2 Tax=Alteromonas lipolytica TaxID=1856405 RepID=A0A1E8F9M2_9ALTE|nr:hypothetical protein BFC17_08100 [Alteromonas lipolytica]